MAIADQEEEEHGFHLVKRRSRDIGPDVVTDLDFIDDIALVSDRIDYDEKCRGCQSPQGCSMASM